MEYRLDNYVSFDMDGLGRLLFESKEYYIYIWVDKEQLIQAFQVNHNVPEKKQEGLIVEILYFISVEKKVLQL